MCYWVPFTIALTFLLVESPIRDPYPSPINFSFFIRDSVRSQTVNSSENVRLLTNLLTSSEPAISFSCILTGSFKVHILIGSAKLRKTCKTIKKNISTLLSSRSCNLLTASSRSLFFCQLAGICHNLIALKVTELKYLQRWRGLNNFYFNIRTGLTIYRTETVVGECVVQLAKILERYRGDEKGISFFPIKLEFNWGWSQQG